jgi:hypothetical protein
MSFRSLLVGSYRFLRCFFDGGPPEISREQAALIARDEFRRRGHGFKEPFWQEKWREKWIVWAYPGAGGNTSLSIDIHTGEVLGTKTVPR